MLYVIVHVLETNNFFLEISIFLFSLQAERKRPKWGAFHLHFSFLTGLILTQLANPVLGPIHKLGDQYWGGDHHVSGYYEPSFFSLKYI